MTYDEAVDFILANPGYHISSVSHPDEWTLFSGEISFSDKKESIDMEYIEDLQWREDRNSEWKSFLTGNYTAYQSMMLKQDISPNQEYSFEIV